MEYFNEMQVTDLELQQKIKEFARLSDKIDELKGELKDLQTRYDGIEEILRPVLDEMKETGDKTLQVEGIIVTVKRYGHERESVGYKDACNYLLERVNASMQKIAQECLDAHTKTVQIATSIGVQKTEGIFSMIGGLVGKIKNLWFGFKNLLGFYNNQIDEAIAEFHEQTSGQDTHQGYDGSWARNEGKLPTFNQWLENLTSPPARSVTPAGHKTQGKLEDWIERNKQWINVKRGYGDCMDCVRIFLDPQAEDEARRHHYSANFDLWGLWHLEDYVVTSRVSGNSVILMPLDEEGLVKKA